MRHGTLLAPVAVSLLQLLDLASAKRKGKRDEAEYTPMDTLWAGLKLVFAFSPFIALAVFMFCSAFESKEKEQLKRAKKHGKTTTVKCTTDFPAFNSRGCVSGVRLFNWGRHWRVSMLASDCAVQTMSTDPAQRQSYCYAPASTIGSDNCDWNPDSACSASSMLSFVPSSASGPTVSIAFRSRPYNAAMQRCGDQSTYG
jgi:hypothetical protein